MNPNETIEKAKELVMKAFAGKRDRNGKPYIGHLTRVAKKVEEIGLDVQAIALLHDLLEDCPEWTEGKLRQTFPHNICDGVVAMTKAPDQDYDDYIEQVCGNRYASIVKKADLEDNMDITRLAEITDEDVVRLRKYLTAYQRVLSGI